MLTLLGHWLRYSIQSMAVLATLRVPNGRNPERYYGERSYVTSLDTIQYTRSACQNEGKNV